MVAVDEDQPDIDIDAQQGQIREAAGKFTSVKYRGHMLQIPPPKLWSVNAMDALQDGNMTVWLEEVIDEKVLDELRDGDEPILVADIDAIFDGVAKKNGMQTGKSVRSSQRSVKQGKK